MGEFADLILEGVYCESCGCFTGVEPGHPVKCDSCHDASTKQDIDDAYERGERL